jgi:hypothetical protein
MPDKEKNEEIVSLKRYFAKMKGFRVQFANFSLKSKKSAKNEEKRLTNRAVYAILILSFALPAGDTADGTEPCAPRRSQFRRE